MSYRIHNTRGVTFIEMLVSIAIFVFAILSITSSVLFFYRTNTYAVEQASAVASAQRGIDNMVKTVREAAYASDGAYPIVAIGTTDFTFYADIDSDILIERVRYYLQGTSLMRDLTDPAGDPPVYGAAQTTSVISETVRNLEQATTLFRYYDEEGDEVTNFAEIGEVRFVTMDIIVNVDPNRLPNQLTLRSSAALRNLK